MEEIKKAFQLVKEDVTSLKFEIQSLRQNLFELNQNLLNLTKKIAVLESNTCSNTSLGTSTHNANFSTIPTHNPAHILPFKPLKGQNLPISTGNQGVPTDSQTDSPTVQQTDFLPFRHYTEQKLIKKEENIVPKNPTNKLDPIKVVPNEHQFTNKISQAKDILDSITELKEEVKIKFKALTPQEIAVFATIYQLEEQKIEVDYKILSQKLNLTQSSIRDYVQRIINKGIPVDKYKLKNKKIILKISDNLKKIASLDAILRLKEL